MSSRVSGWKGLVAAGGLAACSSNVTIDVAGSGGGAGRVRGGTIDCRIERGVASGRCTLTTSAGGSNDLTAVADPRSAFLGWEGCPMEEATSCRLTWSAPSGDFRLHLRARFEGTDQPDAAADGPLLPEGTNTPGAERPDGAAAPPDTRAPAPEAPTSICGNGIVEAPEECDDGNSDSGDGCDLFCHLETPNG